MMNQYLMNKSLNHEEEISRLKDILIKEPCECATLLMIVALNKNIDNIRKHSYSDRYCNVYSSDTIIKLISNEEYSLELLKICNVLSKHLPKQIGNGTDAIRIKGIINLMEQDRYEVAYRIITRKIANIIGTSICEHNLYQLINFCQTESNITNLKKVLLDSWSEKYLEATSLKSCQRPNCKNIFDGDSVFFEGKFCSCGAPFDLIPSDKLYYQNKYAKDILESVSIFSDENLVLHKKRG